MAPALLAKKQNRKNKERSSEVKNLKDNINRKTKRKESIKIGAYNINRIKEDNIKIE